MYLNRVYRQIALVSYGNEFLNGAVDSEILDRHPLLFNHFPILRDIQYGSLLCGSASHILASLKKTGALKLSLHLTQDLKLEIEDTQIFNFSTENQSFCIVIQMTDQSYKALIHSTENPLWRFEEEKTNPYESYDEYRQRVSADYSNYYDNTETYTLHNLSNQNISAIENDLLPINWKDFFEYAQSKLYVNTIAKRYGIDPIPFDTNNCYEGDLFNSIKEEQYPLLPFTIRKNYASNLIENTAILTKYYHSASQCKNEYNDYIQMNDEEKKQFATATTNLTLLHPIILKNTANHYQESGFENTNYFSGKPTSLDSHHCQNFQTALNPPTEENINSSDSNGEIQSTDLSNENNHTQTSFSFIRVIKFFWYLIWCYCAIWTLTNFVVQWGNIVISTCALIYAIYKISKK